MATKTLKKITVSLIGTVGDQIAYAFIDRADDPIASYMLDSFRKEDIMHGVTATGNKEIYIPFHAVDNIFVEEQTTDVANRPNPYGCEADVPCTVAFSGTITTETISGGSYARSASFDFVDYSRESIKATLNGTEYILTRPDGVPAYSTEDHSISISGSGGETQITGSVLVTPTAGTYELKIEICE